MTRRRPIAGALAIAALVATATAGCEPAPPRPVFLASATATGPDAAPGDGACATVGGGCSLEAAVAEANAAGRARIDVGAGLHAAGTLTVTGDVEVSGTTPLSPTGPVAAAPEVDLAVARGATLRIDDVVLGSVAVAGTATVERVVLGSPARGPGAPPALEVAPGGTVVVSASIVDGRSGSAIRNNGGVSARFVNVWAPAAAVAPGEATITTVGSGTTTLGAVAVLASAGSDPAPTCAGAAPVSEGWNAVPDTSCGLAATGDLTALVEADDAPAADSPRTDAVPVGSLGCRASIADPGTVVALDGDGDQTPACDIGAVERPQHPNQPPVAAVELVANSGFVPATVQLSTAGSTDDSGIASSLWSFGDGTPTLTTTGSTTASHVYQDAGTFVVTVTVVDTHGASSSASTTVTVEDRRGSLPLGSPRNHIGTGDLVPGADGELLRLSINPSCTSKINGDRYQSLHHGPLAANQTTLAGCPATPTNPDHRAEGYSLTVEAPEGRTSDIEVLLHDPRYDADPVTWQDGGTTRTEPGIDSFRQAGDEPFTFSLAAADDTPDDDTDNPVLAECTRTFTATTPFELTYLGSVRWNRLCTITPDMPSGRYVLRARNSGVAQANRDGSNQWGLVARYTDAPGDGLCDGRTDPACPRVYGNDDISVFASTPGAVASFFLAEIDGTHAGRTVEIELFDPGEGMSKIEVLRPTGPGTWAATPFDWSSTKADGSPHSAGATGVTSLSVTNSVFNGRLVRIRIPLGDDPPPDGDGWWKVQYTSTSGVVTDRTTWTARIVG